MNGADFVCTGMFDFQIVENINQANDIPADLPERQRRWFLAKPSPLLYNNELPVVRQVITRLLYGFLCWLLYLRPR